MSRGRRVGVIWLRVRVDARRKSPGGLREAFAAELREAIARAYAAGRIDSAIAEELYRALPKEGKA